MQRLELRIDVTAAAPELGEPIEMAVTGWLPDPALLPTNPVAIFACPGGGYSRQYFDMHFPGHKNYSEAEWHVTRGTIYFAIDHVGFGESTIPDLSLITFQTHAATHDSCVRQLLAKLRDGTIADSFPAVSPFSVGMGQSYGGGVSILTQGRFATFDAIAPFGKSAIHTALPQRTVEEFERGIERFEPVATGKVKSHLEMDNSDVDFVYPFHWEDVPVDILEMDMKGGYPIRETVPYFGSGTIPYCAPKFMLPGAVGEDAARVRVPVLVGDGERDTCPNPHMEPSAYPNSQDVSVFIVPRMAHMHNFAGTREILWRRLHAWARMLAEG